MEKLDRIIHQFYEAPDNPEYWTASCEDLSELIGAGAVHLWLASTETGAEYVNLFTRGDSQFASEYSSDYAPMDFRVPRVMARGLGVFSDEREYVSSTEAECSPIHQQLLPRYGIYNISGANMSLDGCIGWFGISTRTPDSEFDAGQIRLLEHASRHLLNALKINRSRRDLCLSRNLAYSCLDLVNVPLIVLDHKSVAYANKAAYRLFDDGFFLLRRGVLSCTNPAGNEKLAQFLRSPSSGLAEMPLLLRNPCGGSFLIRVHNLSPTFIPTGNVTVRQRAISIIELDPAMAYEAKDVAAFCSSFGVSAAEAKAVHAVLTSMSLDEFARSKGITLNTAQQQLKSAMRKMELNSQKKIFHAYARFRSLQALGD